MKYKALKGKGVVNHPSWSNTNIIQTSYVYLNCLKHVSEKKLLNSFTLHLSRIIVWCSKDKTWTCDKIRKKQY